MIQRVFVAVDDSVPSLAAATFAIELARALGAELRLATVAEPDRDPDVILTHLVKRATATGVVTTAATLEDGHHPFEVLLAAASAWGADLIVMGRSDIRRTGRPYVGSQTEHLLEFTEIPVVVVPERRATP